MKEYAFKINGNDYNVAIHSQDEALAEVSVNGTAYTVEIDGLNEKSAAKRPQVAAIPASHPVQPSAVPMPSAAAKPAGHHAAGAGAPVKSPLPGVILDVRVKEGQQIAAGQTLVVLEAMKMENNIDADRAGVVKSIAVGKGDSVLEGDVLITLG